MRNAIAAGLAGLLYLFAGVAATFNPTTANAAGPVQDMTIGSENAPVTVIEYSSYTCPHCANFHESVFPSLKRDYVDTGKVRYIRREVFFDRPGLWATLVAHCEGGKERYFDLSNQLFKSQSQWTSSGDPAQIVAALRELGTDAGLSDAQLDACLSDEPGIRSLIQWYQANAELHDITSTPSFVIDGEKHRNMAYPAFAAAIDRSLEGR